MSWCISRRALVALATLLGVLVGLSLLSLHGHDVSWAHNGSYSDTIRGRPDSSSYLIRWRDAAIRRLWRVPARARQAPLKQSITQQDIVLRFRITNASEAKALREIVDAIFLDIWNAWHDEVDVRIPRDVLPALVKLLPSSMRTSYTTLIDFSHLLPATPLSSSTLDAPSLDSIRTPPSSRIRGTATPAAGANNIFFRDYQPLSVIVPWMRLLQSLFPTHVRLINLGKSAEGRDIHGLGVGVHPDSTSQREPRRQTVLITGGSHAREWISVSTVAYVAYAMIIGYGKNTHVTRLLEEFDWVFVPTINPDGYVYTWEHDRLWRKTRQQTRLPFCAGIDLDRAFGYQWDGEPTSGNPCAEDYAGEAAFEAIEARRLADWVSGETHNRTHPLAAFLDMHSYSQEVLYPFAFACSQTPPNLENLEEVALGIAKALHSSRGEFYGIAPACSGGLVGGISTKNNSSPTNTDGMNVRGGSALDWVYHDGRVKYSYQIKLRDTGAYGFLLPRTEITPTGDEALAAVKFLGKHLLSNRGVESIVDAPTARNVHMRLPEASRRTQEPAKSAEAANSPPDEDSTRAVDL